MSKLEPEKTGEPIIRVEGLEKHFAIIGRGKNTKTLRAVDGVSFALRPGETLAIVGESGSGKSTLARALLRLLEPTSGSVFLNGRNLLDLSSADMRAARRYVQMIFQDPYASLHPRRTVAQAISEPWRIQKGLVEKKDYATKTGELLRQVGLSEAYASAYPNRLSGGERQRVAIARALAMRPDVLILDEPVSALDVSIQAQVINLLMRLQEELHIAYIFISHDLPLVRLVANRVAVMYAGRFVEEGTAEEIFANPAHPYTQALLNSRPETIDIHKSADTDISEGASVINAPSGCSYRLRCPKAGPICQETAPILDTARQGEHGCACHFASNALAAHT